MNEAIAIMHSPYKAARRKATQDFVRSQAVEVAQLVLLSNHQAKASEVAGQPGTYVYVPEKAGSAYGAPLRNEATDRRPRDPGRTQDVRRLVSLRVTAAGFPSGIRLTDDAAESLSAELYPEDRPCSARLVIRKHFEEYEFDDDELFLAKGNTLRGQRCR